jgi:hypothetical protein
LGLTSSVCWLKVDDACSLLITVAFISIIKFVYTS